MLTSNDWRIVANTKSKRASGAWPAGKSEARSRLGRVGLAVRQALLRDGTRSGRAPPRPPCRRSRGSKRKGEGESGAPTCSGLASGSWKATRIGLSREIVPLVKAAIVDFSTSVSSPRSRGARLRAQLDEQPAMRGRREKARERPEPMAMPPHIHPCLKAKPGGALDPPRIVVALDSTRRRPHDVRPGGSAVSNRRLSLLAALMALAANTLADTLVLRSGRRVEGDLVGVRGSTVEFDEGGSTRRYDRSEVARIELGSGVELLELVELRPQRRAPLGPARADGVGRRRLAVERHRDRRALRDERLLRGERQGAVGTRPQGRPGRRGRQPSQPRPPDAEPVRGGADRTRRRLRALPDRRRAGTRSGCASRAA